MSETPALLTGLQENTCLTLLTILPFTLKPQDNTLSVNIKNSNYLKEGSKTILSMTDFKLAFRFHPTEKVIFKITCGNSDSTCKVVFRS